MIETLKTIFRRFSARLESRFSAALTLHTDPIAIFDPQDRLVFCNSAYRRTVALCPETVRPGVSCRTILSNAIEDGLICEPDGGIDAFLAGLTSQDNRSERLLKFGNKHFRMMCSSTSTGDLLVLMSDITEHIDTAHAAELAQERLHVALETFPDPMGIYQSDGRLLICNSAYQNTMSNDRVRMEPGQHFREIYSNAMDEGLLLEPPEGREALFARIKEESNAGRPIRFQLELAGDRYQRTYGMVAESGDFIVVRNDVTELVRQNRAAKATQRRLGDAIDAYPGPFSLYDGNQRLVVCNAAYKAGMSKNPESIQPGQLHGDILRGAIKDGYWTLPPEGVDVHLDEHIYSEIRDTVLTDKIELPGDVHHRVLRRRSESGDVVLVRIDDTVLVRQARELEKSAERLKRMNDASLHQSLHDELTGLGNRRFLTEQFVRLIEKRNAEGGEISILNLDLDRFKQINDSIGHAAGDFVLQRVGECLRDLTGPDEWAFRNGGDEFVVLIWEQAASDRSSELAHALVRELSRPVMFGDCECRFGATVGLASTPLSEAEELLSNSDIALYRAKADGRGCVRVFDASDLVELRKRQVTANEILVALERSEFEPYYQPQIDCETGRVVGLEALARWNHPEDGVRTPDNFMAVADYLNVVPDIDRMIFRKAIEQCGAAFASMETIPSLSFNASAGRIRDADLSDISDTLRLYPGQVVFELLETIFLEEEDTAFLMQLDRLREIGVLIEVDDFGSGRASIVALQRIGPDRLKIDRRLVGPITSSPKAAQMVRSIVELGNAMEIGIVAEGVETAEHARLLTELGVERLQGFHFARPLCFADLCEFLRESEGNSAVSAG